jgi:hypothetical protein
MITRGNTRFVRPTWDLLSTFIPTDDVRRSLEKLWNAYNDGSATSATLNQLRRERGPFHYERFEKYFVALMKRMRARTAIFQIAVASVQRDEQWSAAKEQIRQLHQLG